MKWRKKLLLAKAETTYGTDAAPGASANAIETENGVVTPLVATAVQRNIDGGRLGQRGTSYVGHNVRITFDVALAASGTAGLAPAWGPLLLGCAMAETVTADTSVAYTPVSADEGSTTLWWYQDGVVHKVVGARGTVRLRGDVPGYGYLSFEFVGLYVPPQASVLPEASMAAWQSPVPLSAAATEATLHGVAIGLTAFELSLANDNQYRETSAGRDIRFLDRQPSGSLTFEMPPLATKDWFGVSVAETRGPLSIVHGTTAGSIVEVSAPAVQIGEPAYTEITGNTGLQIPILLHADEGDDDLVITAR